MTDNNVDKKAVDWHHHVEQCHLSGMSRSKYARIHHLNYDQLIYRYRKAYPVNTGSAREDKPKSPKSDFIRVQVTDQEQSSTAGSVSVITADGLKVDLGQRWSPREVVDFLRMWREA